MKKYAVLIGLLIASVLIFWIVTQKPAIPNTYKDIAITPGTLVALLPSPAESDRIALENQLEMLALQQLLDQLLSFRDFPDWKAKMAANNALLKKMNLPNLSRANYVFKLPDTDFLIKIAGPANRFQSTLMAHGFWPGEQPDKPITKVDTYQTASRAAYYLILKEFIEKNRLKHISVLETYLIRYPHSATSIDDEHVFIVEKALPYSAVQLTAERAQSLSNDVITEIIEAIIGCGLWNIKNNLFIDNQTGKISFVDVEQPNNSAPTNFFHKDPIRYYGNLRAGLEEFIDLFARNPAKLSFIRSLIEKNPVFNSRNFYPRYKAELINVLNNKAPSLQVQIKKAFMHNESSSSPHKFID